MYRLSKRNHSLKRRRRTHQKHRSVEPMESRMLLSATAGVDHSGALQRIVNGNETTDYEAVGIVNGGCTGTLISPTHVLTAAHCTEGVGNRRGTFEVGGERYRTTTITDHPQYNPNRFHVGYDLSIMELDKPVTGIDPMQIYRQTPRVGQMLTLVGFGEGGTSRGGSSNDFGTKRVGTTPIDQVTNLHVEWDFDSHDESNTAPGDSGGPAFVTVDGELFIAGVTSGGDGDAHTLGDHSFDTRIDVFAQWIDSIVGDGGGGGNGGGGNGRQEFTSSEKHVIPNDRTSTIVSKLDVSGVRGSITDINVTVDIDHTWTEDLTVQLIAPNGRRITLFKAVGGDGSDFDNTGLDDEASTSIKNASAPFRGVFRPAGKLSNFDGLSPNGEWKLRVRDTFADDGGVLNGWSVSLETDGDDDGGGGGGNGSSSGTFRNNQKVDIDSDRANTVRSTVDVAGMTGQLTDVNVKLNIDHTWNSDLVVVLVSPAGDKVQLFRNVGGDGDGFHNTILDDSATASIRNGSAPFTGTFKPLKSLGVFNGQSANGEWTLIVRDRYAGDGGSLNNWELTLETDGQRSRNEGVSGDRELRKNRRKKERVQARRVQRQTVSPATAVSGIRQRTSGGLASSDAGRRVIEVAATRSTVDGVFADSGLEVLLESL